MVEDYKHTEVGVIPEDWKLVNFSEVSFMKGRIGWQGLKKTEFTFNSNDPFLITGMNFKDGEIRWDEVYHVSEDRYEVAKEIQLVKNDVLMTKDGTIGKLLFVTDIPFPYKATLNSHLLLFRPLRNSYHPKYLYYNMLSKFFFEHIELHKSGTTFFGISQESVGKYKLILPPLPEQQAIAEVLSDTDKLIQTLEKRIAKKRNIKQGAMQKLLTPKEDWETKKLGDFSIVGRGRVISHKEIALSTQMKYPVYSSQTSNNGIMGYIDTYDFDGEYITWTTDGVYAGKVYYRNGKFNCTNVCGTIKLLQEDALFVSIILDTLTSKYVSTNLANPKLMNDPVKKIEVPLQISEQNRIATILSDMDKEIEQLEEKLDKYKDVKKGLMQQLLTGKIRLI